MPRPALLYAVLASALLPLAACNSQYNGDGTLVDHGPFSATDRYVLDLGPLPTAADGPKTYRLKNLPAENFVLGVELQHPSAAVDLGDKPISPLLEFVLEDAAGRIVARKMAPLSDWTWSVPSTGEHAFVYGAEPEGTYFTAAESSSFVLRVTVGRSDSDAVAYSPRVLAKSGGWK